MSLMRVAMFWQFLKLIFAKAGGRLDLAYSPQSEALNKVYILDISSESSLLSLLSL